MAPRSEEQLFEAYRRDGDTEALADLFDATAKELLRLAVHLCGELSDAEDLVQETYLAAIESAARWRSGKPVRAWLVGILQNRARRLFRDRQRRRRQLAQPVAAPSAAETAARSDLRDTVRTAIATLAEPYRTVVGLHAQHGFTIAEIATTLSRSPHTVRSQLTRGLDRVEPRLPQRSSVAVAPALLAMRQVVVEHGAAQVVQVGAGTGLGVAKWAILAAVLLLVVVPVSWWVIDDAADPSPTGVVVASATHRDATQPPLVENRAPAPSPQSSTSQRLIKDPVRFCVVDRQTGEPVPGATVGVWGGEPFRQMDLSPAEFSAYAFLHAHDQEALMRRYGTSITTDADGTFVLDGLQSLVITARKGGLYGQVFDDQRNVIFVEPDRQLTVEVVDAAGAPVSGVHVRVSGQKPFGGHVQYRCSTRGRTDQHGVAVVPHIQLLAAILATAKEDSAWVSVVTPGRVLPRQAVPTAALGAGTVRIQLPPSGTVRARVFDHAGEIIAAQLDRDTGLSVSLSKWGDLRPVGTEWVIDRVPVGEEFHLEASLHGATCQQRVSLRRAGEERVVELRFGAGVATHVGRAVDARGRPIANREIACYAADYAIRAATLTETDATGRFWFHTQTTDEAATLHLQVVDVERERVGWDRLRTGRNASAAVEVAALSGGVFQLGDVRFDPAPRLGDGRLQLTPPGFLDELRRHRLDIEHKVGDRWRGVPAAALVWGKDGRFEVFGRTTGDELRVRFPGSLSGRQLMDIGVAALEFRRGDMLLDFERSIAGEIALDVQTLGAKLGLKYEVQPVAGGPAVEHRLYPITRPASYGQHGLHVLPVLTPVPPGIYRVRIRNADGDLLRVLDEVDVRSAQRSRPMLDDPLDLRR